MSRLDTYVQPSDYNKIKNTLEKLLQTEAFCHAIDTLNFDAAYNTLKESIDQTGMFERVIVNVFLNEIINSLGEQEFIDSDMILPKTYFNIWNEFIFEDELIITDNCKQKFKGNTFEGRVVIDCDVPKDQFSLVTFKKDVLEALKGIYFDNHNLFIEEGCKEIGLQALGGLVCRAIYLPSTLKTLNYNSFDTEDIIYNGTVQQFTTLMEESNWKESAKQLGDPYSGININCLDGMIDLSQALARVNGIIY